MYKKLITLNAFLILTVLSAFARSSFPPGKTDEDLKAVVTREYENFKLIAPGFGLSLGNLVFSNASTHVVTGNPDVNINLDEIGQYTAGESDAFKTMFVRFVIGHELGHKFQFNGYRQDVIHKSKGEGTVFLECYADILAGMMVSGIANTVDKQQAATTDDGRNFSPSYLQNVDLSFAVLKKILTMDRLNVTVETHPRNIERLVAFRQGLLMGNCFLLHLLFTTKVDAFRQLPQSEQNRLTNLASLLNKELGYDPMGADNPFSWCHAEAIRVIHENNSLVRNLIRYDEQIDWDPNPNHSVVNFSFRVLNHNPTSVQFSGRVYTEIILRSDPKNILKTGANDSYPFTVIIRPGESVQLKGELTWVADNDYMPQIVIPGDGRSLYWAFDSSNPLPDPTPVASDNTDFSTWQDSTPDDIADLVTNVVLIRNKLFENSRGVGISKFSDTADVDTHSIYYDPIFKLGNEADQQIVIQPDDPTKNYYTFQAFSAPDTVTANQRFQLVADKIKAAIPQIPEGNILKLNTTRTVAFRQNGKTIVRIRMNYGEGDKPTTAVIEIDNK